MSKEEIEEKVNKDESMTFLDLWRISIYNWKWILFSIVVSIGFGIAYTTVSTPIYKRGASLLIKDDPKSGMGMMNNTVFSNLDILKTNTNVYNEMLTLQSPALMLETVKRLKLNMHYAEKGWLKNKDLYNQSPINVVLPDVGDESTLSFQIDLLPGKKVKLSEFDDNGKKLAGVVTGNMSSTLKTPSGNIVITPSEHYTINEDYKTILFAKQKSSLTAEAYNSALEVSLGDKDATIINLNLNSSSTQRAEDILNTLINVYNESWVEDKNKLAISTSGFIDKRLGMIENELGGVDNDISEFKSKNLIPDIQATTGLYMQEYFDNKSKILVLNNQISIIRYIRNYLKDPNLKNQLIPINSGTEGLNIEPQINEYNTLLLKRNNLIANSGENNPLLKDMDKSLSSMRASISQSVDNLLSTQNLQVDNLRRFENVTNQQIASNPNQAKYLISVERQQKIKEALYLYLLQKREENELSKAFTAYNTRVINPPSGSDIPIFPKKKYILLVAFVIGLGIPVLILFLLTNMDTSVRNRKDLEGLSIPLLGEIPFNGKLEKKSFWKRLFPAKRSDDDNTKNIPKIVVEDKKRNIINEAFRVVRTNLEFMNGADQDEKAGKVLMLTSFNANSGKTFIGINLARSLALTGKRVVVVDLDMRKSETSKIIKSPRPGLSNYLADFEDDFNKILYGTEYDKVDILPVGTMPPNPTELLLSSKLGPLFDYLRKTYDYIILDSTPVDVVADASIVGKYADLVVFVVRIGLLDRRLLPELETMYKNKRFKHMVTLLNGGLTHSGGRYGYHRYGYGYGYGYGYSYGYATSNQQD